MVWNWQLQLLSKKHYRFLILFFSDSEHVGTSHHHMDAEESVVLLKLWKENGNLD